jgi:hypothetical protein
VFLGRFSSRDLRRFFQQKSQTFFPAFFRPYFLKKFSDKNPRQISRQKSMKSIRRKREGGASTDSKFKCPRPEKLTRVAGGETAVQEGGGFAHACRERFPPRFCGSRRAPFQPPVDCLHSVKMSLGFGVGAGICGPVALHDETLSGRQFFCTFVQSVTSYPWSRFQ